MSTFSDMNPLDALMKVLPLIATIRQAELSKSELAMVVLSMAISLAEVTEEEMTPEKLSSVLVGAQSEIKKNPQILQLLEV